MKSSLPNPTSEESARMERMKSEIGCICCRLLRLDSKTPLEIHHLLIGGKRA